MLRSRQSNECCLYGAWLRMQFQYGGCDDAQCAFCSDIKITQIVTGIVLAQAAQSVPYLALRCDDFQAQAQFTCIAITQNSGSSGIRGQIATYGATTFC